MHMFIANEDLSAIDYVFCWLGNADILLAIIKLIEDKMNAEQGILDVGVCRRFYWLRIQSGSTRATSQYI